MDHPDTDDERVEELNTLQSIYPELQIDKNSTSAPAATIELLVAPSKPLPIVFESDQTVYRLAYLPPLLLDMILYKGYPAERAPDFKLATNPAWLPEKVIQKLEKEGQSLCEEYGGMPMLFAYVSYLQESTDIVFGLGESLPEEPLRLPDTMKKALLSYNDRMQREIFDKETFDCGICLEPKKGSACYRMKHCSHVFCVACLQDYYNNCIKEGDVNNVKCLSPDCGKTGDIRVDRRKKDRLISPKELLQIPLKTDTVKRYAELKRKKKMEADSSMVFCPRSWCQGPMRSEKYPKITDVTQMDESDHEEELKAPDTPDEDPNPNEALRPANKATGASNTDRLVICEKCNLAFCKVCLASWHGDLVRCITRAANELTEEDQASLNYIMANTTPCPTCSVPSQKMHGCNHMTCFQCKSHFCYLCSAWLEPGNPYRHFNDKRNKSCYQRLMDGALGDQIDGGIRFGGRRGAEQEAEFWEQEAMRIQMEELEPTR